MVELGGKMEPKTVYPTTPQGGPESWVRALFLREGPITPIDFHGHPPYAFTPPFNLYTDTDTAWLRLARARQGSE